MSFKNFLVSITKSLIIILVVTYIFSSLTLKFTDLSNSVLGDIFEYTSPDVQKQVVSKLTESCSLLGQESKIVTLNQICANSSLLDAMRESCKSYDKLKNRGAKIENEQQVRETCEQIESGKIEMGCEEFKDKRQLSPDIGKIGALCKDYKASKISDKEFFFGVIGSAFPNQFNTPDIGILEKYNQTLNYLNSNKPLYIAILFILMSILYLLAMDTKLFFLALSGISFSIGTLIIFPYIAILAYEKFVGFDTTPILGSIFDFGSIFDAGAIISVILLLFLRTYTSFIVGLGAIFLAIGLLGKIYGFVLSRKGLAAKAKFRKKKIKKT